MKFEYGVCSECGHNYRVPDEIKEDEIQIGGLCPTCRGEAAARARYNLGRLDGWEGEDDNA